MRARRAILALVAGVVFISCLQACGGGKGGNKDISDNTAPVADAGTDQSVTTGGLVTLNGSGTDADGDALTYSWSFTSNPGSAGLSDPTAPNPTFTPDVDGTYELSLIVNDGIVDSAADTVRITATNGVGGNTAPVADAGTDQSVTTGGLVTLNGSGTDADGDALTYSWSFTSNPGSAGLSDPAAAAPTFTPAVDGIYELSLIVNDGTVDSAADTVKITAAGGGGGNTAPVADAGPDQTVIIGDLVTLNGSGTDADGDTLTYSWSFISSPLANPDRSLNGHTIANPTFTASLVGIYELSLIVSDGTVNSAPDTVTVTAMAPPFPDTGQTTCYDLAGNFISCAGTGQDGEYSINPMSSNDNGNGTVTDNNTRLMWQKYAPDNADNTTLMTWAEAETYCNGLTLGGYYDWRLPDVMELMSIVNYERYNPAIDITVFPNWYLSGNWSSTPNASNATSVWSVNFYYGVVSGGANKTGTSHVRCVRGDTSLSQSFTDNLDGTVTDNITDFMWQQCSAGQGGTGCGTGTATTYTWQGALDYCNSLSLAGHTDWRLPNVKELRSVVDNAASDPAIDATYFPNTSASQHYWSSTTYDYGPESAWVVNFLYGSIYSDQYKSGYYTRYNAVRCVR